MYILICITDRNVDYIEEFHSYEEAYAIMKEEFLDDIKVCYHADNYDENAVNYHMNSFNAWAGITGDDSVRDWHIKELK